MNAVAMQGGPNVQIEPDVYGRDSSEHGTDAAGRLSLIEPGWFVHGWTGRRIGTVVDVGSDGLLVRLNSIDAHEVRVPAALVSVVDATDRRATLSVDASELDGVELQTRRIDLVERPT